MAKIIQFPGTQTPSKTTPKKPAPINEEYMDALVPLANQATEIANKYGYGAKDVLTDALVVLIRDAMLDQIVA